MVIMESDIHKLECYDHVFGGFIEICPNEATNWKWKKWKIVISPEVEAGRKFNLQILKILSVWNLHRIATVASKFQQYPSSENKVMRLRRHGCWATRSDFPKFCFFILRNWQRRVQNILRWNRFENTGGEKQNRLSHSAFWILEFRYNLEVTQCYGNPTLNA